MSTTTGLSKSQEPKAKSTIGIRGRLILGFGVITLIFVIAISISLVIITNTKNSARVVLINDLPSYANILDIGGNLYLTESSLSSYLLTKNPYYQKEFNRGWNNIDKLQNDLDTLAKDWTDAGLINTWQTANTEITQLKNLQLEVINNPNRDLGIQSMTASINPLFNKILD